MSDWKNFSNRHKGESCYIFGDGPSIKWFDLGLFSDKPSIFTGLLHHHNDFYKLNVKYATLIEPWGFAHPMIRGFFTRGLTRTQLDTDYIITNHYRQLVKDSSNIDFFINLSNMLSFRRKNIHYIYRNLPEIRNRTDKILSKFNLFGGSFHCALSLAYYFGFSKIYLVGHDAWTIQPVRNLRFYESGRGKIFDNVPGFDELLEIFKNEMDIYTISVNGHSNNVRNINYEDYTGVPPVYKENFEIINEKSLKMFSLLRSHDVSN